MSDKELAAFLGSGAQSYGKSAYMLVYERKSKRDLKEFCQDEEGKETCRSIPFREVTAHVPDRISKEVNADNKTFLRDAQLFNEQFFDLTKEILRCIGQDLVLTSHQYPYEYHQYFVQLKEASLEMAGKLIFDMLCYFDHNVQLSSTAGYLSSILTFSDSRFSLKNKQPSLVVKFAKQFFLDDCCEHFFKIMFTCTDATSRRQAGAAASRVMVRLFKLYADCDPGLRENSELVQDVYKTADTFLSLCMTALQDKECLRNWTRLECFFEMLYEISTSCVTAAQHMMDRSDVISDLIDFMLGNKSPRALAEGEKRVAMGGTIPPPFQQLYTLVSFFICMTHTSQMDLEVRMPTHAKLTTAGEHDNLKTYFLSEEAVLMLSKTDFLDRVIFDSKYDEVDQFAKAMAHLCYDNLKFSRKVAKILLKTISYSSNEQVERLLKIIEQIAQVPDQYAVHRLEFLFGFGFIGHIKTDTHEIPQYGAQVMLLSKDQDVYRVSSGLDARNYDDALLNMLLKYKGRMEGFTLRCLESLGELLVKDSVIRAYVSSLPASNYFGRRYTDWVAPYLLRQLEESKKYGGSGSKEKQESIEKVRALFDQYQELIAQQEEPAPYIVVQALEEKVVQQQVFDEAVEIQVTQIKGSFMLSQPTGEANLSMDLAGAVTSEEKLQSQAIKGQFSSSNLGKKEPAEQSQ